MKTLLRPYEGTLPYLFVSYAHKNDAAVLEIISTLQSRGFRVWYDEGIEAGSEWPESIASHLERAQLVLAFLSPAYLRSDNCRKEMHYALTKKKPVINVYLEPTELSPGMEMQIGNLFALMKYTYPSEEYFYDKLFSAELLDAGKFAGEPPELPDAPAPAKKAKEKTPRGESPRRARREKPGKAPKPTRLKKRRRGLAAAIIAVVLVGCLIAAGIVGHFTGLLYRFTVKTVAVQTLADDTVAQFQNPLLEQAARDYAGKPAGELTVADLKGLTALYVCGDRYWFAAPQQGVDAAAAGVETAEMIDPSGQTVTVRRGDIRDLSDLAYFPSLTAVADLAREPARLRCGGVRCQRQPAHEPVGHRAAAEAHGPHGRRQRRHRPHRPRPLSERAEAESQRRECVGSVRAARAHEAAGRHALALHAPRAADPAAQVLAHARHARGLRSARRFLPQLRPRAGAHGALAHRLRAGQHVRAGGFHRAHGADGARRFRDV